VEVVVPVHDEEDDLERSVRALRAYLDEHVPYDVLVTIADNASTDGTPALAVRLAQELDGVRAVVLERKGRGRALAAVWGASRAEVVAYMDVDLSTDLAAFPALVAPLLSGHSDVAIGTRLARGARVTRGAKREAISRAYNLILRTALRARFSDAQCGFKAVRADVARALLARVENRNWFFDTELLVLAQRSGARIHEVPVDWIDDPDSSVDVVATAREDLAGVWRMLRARGRGAVALPGRSRGPDPRRRLARQLLTFGAIGLVSTAAYVGIYAGLRTVTSAVVANAIALVLTAIANTAANARLTFGARGWRRVLGDQVGGGFAFALALGMTTAGLAALQAVDPSPSRAAELTALVIASALATLTRFVLLRGWISRGSARTPQSKEAR
jgi:putative flippase GtrA